MKSWAIIASLQCPIKGALKREYLKVKISQKLPMFVIGGSL